MQINELKEKLVTQNIITYLKTALVFLIIYACFLIFKPFMLPVIWGVILAVALYPVHLYLSKKFNSNTGLSATVITIFVIAIIIVPVVIFTGSLVDSIKELADQFREGTITVKPPPEKVEGWPVVGKPVYDIWLLFSENVSEGISEYKPQIQKAGEWLLLSIKDIIGSLFMFIFAIIVAGVFLSRSKNGYPIVYKTFNLLIGEKGKEFANSSKATISSVVNGILGTAIIQTTIIALALFIFKVPFAAVLTLIILFFAIAQLPTILVLLPVIIYMFSELSGAGAVIFAIWGVLGSLSDNVLKPMLLGRGIKIPMLVILIGSIGGMLLLGIIGLFIGAVILALGYQLLQLWIDLVKTKEQ